MLLALLLMASTASAADKPTPPKIFAFVDCTTEASIWVVPDAKQEGLYEAARQCLDDKVADALEEAGDSNDLRVALKTFYLKGKARFWQRAPRSAEAEFSEARNAVFLEAKLAGLAKKSATPKPAAK